VKVTDADALRPVAVPIVGAFGIVVDNTLEEDVLIVCP
jgi:hypothetical protein